MKDKLLAILRPLASLRLTVVLLALAMALVFSSTIAQLEKGIWQVKAEYFMSFFVLGEFGGPIRLLIPGGYLVGGGLMANVLAAYALRFRWDRKRIGVLLIHSGVVLLLVGELTTGLLAVESQMEIDEGQTVNYSFDIREVELALVDPSPADVDMVYAVDQDRLRDGAVVRDALLPVDLRVDEYMANSAVFRLPQGAPPGEGPVATQGTGVGLVAEERPRSSGVSDQGVDAPSAYVTLLRDGRELGTWLVSVYLDEQPVTIEGRTYLLSLRFRRYYKDYRVHLIDFSHDRYTGTDVPMNFSSRVRIEDPDLAEPREVLIYMNNPLRYEGETFYQSAFKNNDRTTVLQVVENPTWTLPYLAVTLSALGMLLHFGANLLRFLRRRSA